MTVKYTTTNEVVINGVKILVIGLAGVGKTKLCATMPKPLIVSAEGGMLSLKDYTIPVAEITTLDDLIEVYNYCLTQAFRDRFLSICVDSTSEIADKILANMKPQFKDPRQAYGETADKMLEVLIKFRDLVGTHVYMTCKAEPTKDEVSGIVKYGPMMPGKKIAPAMPYLFDECFALRVGRTTDGKAFRYLQTQPDYQWEAKDRSGALADMEEPHLGKIITKITGIQYQ